MVKNIILVATLIIACNIRYVACTEIKFEGDEKRYIHPKRKCSSERTAPLACDATESYTGV